MQKFTSDNPTLEELKQTIKLLKELSLKDPHTGLYNYRYLKERFPQEFTRAKRYFLPLSIVMIDIDYFKSVNDVYGHQFGNYILKKFAQYLKRLIREYDIVFRYGGEEFIILFPDTDKESALNLCQRIWEKLTVHIFDPHGEKLKLKVSLGIVSYPEDGIDTPSALLDSVDKALMDAKERGGNRISTFRELDIKEAEKIVNEGGKEKVELLKRRLSKLEKRVNQVLLESIYAFCKTIEARDQYVPEHTERMEFNAIEIGKGLGLSKKELKNLEHAAVLYDLGKIGISNKILKKEGKLTPEEYDLIKKHPQIGVEIIRPIHFLNEVVPIVLYHHERFDGSGYPSGLKGKEIPLGARIIAVVDTYQALISDRPYRKAYAKDEVLKKIKEGSGTQFDPEIVDIFVEINLNKEE